MPRSPEQKVETRRREAQVLNLRKGGATFQQIANTLGYKHPSGAKIAYDRAMQNTIQQPADELRALEQERLDALLMALWPQAMAGKGYAVERCLQIMDRRARLLGLDMPTKFEHTLTDPMLEKIAELESELGLNDRKQLEAAKPESV